MEDTAGIPRKSTAEDTLAGRRRGGKVVLDEQEVPGMGWFSLFSDPDGRVMGIWKAAM